MNEAHRPPFDAKTIEEEISSLKPGRITNVLPDEIRRFAPIRNSGMVSPTTTYTTEVEEPSRPEDEGEAGPTDIKAILADRGKTHGDYTDHAAITQMLKRIMRMGKNWETLSDVQKETLEMNAHKVGRILSGNPNHKDHWDDIAGYAVLVSERI